MRLVRRLEKRSNKSLTGPAKTALAEGIAARAPDPEHASRFLTQEVMSHLGGSHATSTINTYTPWWAQWKGFAVKNGIPHLPVNPAAFVAFLAEKAAGDRTASNTEARCAAAKFFSSLSGHANPLVADIVIMVRASIGREKGFASSSKDPIFASDTPPSAANQPLPPKASRAWGAFSREGKTRADDTHDLLLMDMIHLPTIGIRNFLLKTKTDKHNKGQFSTVPLSSAPDSAYIQAHSLIEAGIRRLQALPAELRNSLVKKFQEEQGDKPVPLHMELTFPAHLLTPLRAMGILAAHRLPFNGTWLLRSLKPGDNLSERVAYKPFLRMVKRDVAEAGLNPSRFGTHSFRHGGTTEALAKGVPLPLVQQSLRHRSSTSTLGYSLPVQNAIALVEAGASDHVCNLPSQPTPPRPKAPGRKHPKEAATVAGPSLGSFS